MTRFAPVYRALGMVIMLFGLTMLAPLILSYVVDDGAQTAYDEAFGLTMLSGLFLWYRFRRCKRELTIRDGFLMVVLVWTVLPAFAAIPLMLQLGISHTDDWTAITRHGEVVIAHHDTVIQAGDHVIVFCTRKKLVRKVEKLFQVGFHFL